MAFYYTLLLSALMASFAAALSAESYPIMADLIRRDSPGSPFYDPSKTRFDRLRSAFERSIIRKSSLNLYRAAAEAAAAGDGSGDVKLEAPVTPMSGEYLMGVGMGTPALQVLAVADTGSDLTWIQCKPCERCYNQRDPIFDSNASSTYHTLGCGSPQCSQLPNPSCKNNVCAYDYEYGDNSYTFGDLATETVTIGRTKFPGVAFGCGHYNGGTFSADGSGIIGLGGGALSLVSQLNKTIGGKFSYCLTFRESNVTSKIRFGPGSVVSGPGVVSTPLIKKDPDTFYYLTLEGASVGTKRIDYPRSYAAVDEGNIIIDSGTTLTFFPQYLSQALEDSLEKVVRGKRVDDPQGFFNLCYQKSPDFQAPPIVVHFGGGADVKLTAESVFLEVANATICLTIVPTQDLAIFGNLHQLNYRVGYDIGGGKLNFLRTDCSKGSD